MSSTSDNTASNNPFGEEENLNGFKTNPNSKNFELNFLGEEENQSERSNIHLETKHKELNLSGEEENLSKSNNINRDTRNTELNPFGEDDSQAGSSNTNLDQKNVELNPLGEEENLSRSNNINLDSRNAELNPFGEDDSQPESSNANLDVKNEENLSGFNNINLDTNNTELNPFGEDDNQSGSINVNLDARNVEFDPLGEEEDQNVSGSRELEVADPPGPNCTLDATNKKLTDVYFLIVFAAFLSIVLGFIVYCACYGDILRITKGYDQCGRVCGQTPQNSSDLQLQDCYNSQQGFNGCLPAESNPIAGVYADLELYWKEFMLLCTLSLGLSFGLFILIRYCADYMVWIILICFNILCICMVIFVAFVFLWLTEQHNERIYGAELSLGIFISFVFGSAILLIGGGFAMTLSMRLNVEIIIKHFEEAGKAIGSMPGILLTPVLTFVAFASTATLWLYFVILIRSSGHLIQSDQNEFNYQMDGGMKAAEVLNVLGMLWMISFILDCQHVVVADAVFKWYFTRDKLKFADFPIAKGIYKLARYHLGSVAIGSVCSIIVWVPNLVIQILHSASKYKRRSGSLVNHRLDGPKHRLLSFGKPAYTLVVIDGCSFFEARKEFLVKSRALPLITEIKSVGDFVLILSQIMVLFVTEATALFLLKGVELQHPMVFLTLVGIFSVYISHSFVTVFEMTIETLFISLCTSTYSTSKRRSVYVSNTEFDVDGSECPDTFRNESVNSHVSSFDTSLIEYVKISQEALKTQRRALGMNQRRIKV